MIRDPKTWQPSTLHTIKVIATYLFFVFLSALLLSACSNAPLKSCKEDPDQFRCQPRERGGRQVKWKMPYKIRYMICTDRLADPKLVQIAKCRKNYMLAGL